MRFPYHCKRSFPESKSEYVMGSRTRKENPKPSTIARRRLYARRKKQIIDVLGGVCAHCGTDRNLTFDHIDGVRDWDPRTVHATKRLRIYLEEAEAGLGQLLCLSCNSAKGDGPEDCEIF